MLKQPTAIDEQAEPAKPAADEVCKAAPWLGWPVSGAIASSAVLGRSSEPIGRC